MAISSTALAAAWMGTGVAQASPAAAASPGRPGSPARSALPALSPAAAANLGKHVDQRVIVVLKNQYNNLPDTRAGAGPRARAVAADQGAILRDLRSTSARQVKPLNLVNAVAATVSAGEAQRLAADPAVARVVPDVTIPLSPLPMRPLAVARLAAGPGRPATTAASEPTCAPGPDGVELDPEALSVIHAASTNPAERTAQGLGFTGKGVTVAYLAEQTNVDEPGFIRPDGSHVFTDYKDFTGEGATTGTFGGEAVLDASSIAAQGNQVFALGSCHFRVLGAAPGASLVGIKVFPQGALAATSSALLAGINYAVSVDHVNVLNESFGYNPLPDTAVDLIRQADEAAVQAGTVVVVSSGDAGPTQTFGSPSTDPAVISAGATTTFRTYAQADIANYNEIGATGWVNDNMSALSSSGLAEDLKAPDVVAPGDLNWALDNPAPGVYAAGISGGTSEAAPLTSATAALVIQAYRQSHRGATPSPALVKKIITSTTDDLGHPGYEQGTGLLDSYRAVEAALSVKTPAGAPRRHGGTLLTSTDQLRATAVPGTVKRFQVTVTNNGQSTQRIRLQGRVLGSSRQVASQTVTLSDTSGSHFNGLNVQKVTFHVPVGASRLQANIAAPTNDSSMDLALLSPLGQLVGYSLPQGTGNHGDVQVRYPGFGTWTAVITDFTPANGGYAGPVAFRASVARYQSIGRVSPAHVTLRSGASRTVTVRVATPSSPGDLSAALVLNAPFGRRTSIPINLRSLVPLGRRGTGRFSASVGGGNGRGGAPAVTRFYQFDVPAGRPALDVQTTVSSRAVNPYDVYLVDPQGETVGHASNQLVIRNSSSGPVTVTERGARAHVLYPARGRWTLVVVFSNPVAGTALTTTLRGTVSFTAITARVSGLPDSSSARLVAGRAHMAKVTVHNSGSAPETYFVDARLNHEATLTLRSYTPASNLTLPLSTSVPTPQWIVPTETTRMVASAEATAPVTFDWAPYTGYLGGDLNGDPDLGAVANGDTAVGTWSHNPVTPGDWEIDPALIGPFGATAPPSATANLALAVRTKAFDSTVRSTTGDFWAIEAGLSSQGFTPVIVWPGQTTTIRVVITPTGKVGSVLSGTLYLDDVSSLSPFGQAVPAGQELAAIPYRYKVR